jgi:hypothetical protein
MTLQFPGNSFLDENAMGKSIQVQHKGHGHSCGPEFSKERQSIHYAGPLANGIQFRCTSLAQQGVDISSAHVHVGYPNSFQQQNQYQDSIMLSHRRSKLGHEMATGMTNQHAIVEKRHALYLSKQMQDL